MLTAHESRNTRDPLLERARSAALRLVEPAGQTVPDSLRLRWAVPEYHFYCNVPAQGFKLHITATLSSAPDVFDRVVPHLLDQRIDFKLAPNLKCLTNLNSGIYGLTQVGKFMTVYPETTERAVELAKDLDERTAGLKGPYVPTDRVFKPGSIVSYRYGVISGREQARHLGDVADADKLERPDGTLVEDERAQLRPVPDWIADPFPYALQHDPLDRRGASALLGNRYVVIGVIQQRGGGGVYRAVQLPVVVDGGLVRPTGERGRIVVIKEARFQGEADEEGTTAQDRLRWQALMLQVFTDSPSFANVIELFDWNNSLYLVMEQLKGKSIKDLVSNGIQVSPPVARQIVHNLANVLRTMHQRDVTYGDLSPGNVMVADDHSVALADLEHCYHCDRPWGGFFGTSGFYPPHVAPGSSNSQRARQHRDLYALSALVYALLNSQWYADVLQGGDMAKAWDRPSMPDCVPPAFVGVLNDILTSDDRAAHIEIDTFIRSIEESGNWHSR